MPLSLDPIQKLIKSKDIITSEEEFDENFNAITSHVERGEYEEAIPLIESSFNRKICDIRLAVYWMYLDIHSGGIQSLSKAIPLLNLLISSEWDKLSPLPRRDQHAEKSIRWFLTRLIKTFEKVNQSSKNRDYAALKSITNGITDEMVRKLKEDLLSLNETLIAKWDNPSIGNHLLNVQKWAIDLSQASFSLQSSGTEVKINSKESETKYDPKIEDHKEDIHLLKPQDNDKTSIPNHLLEPSRQMKLLYQKLQAFQLCIERRDYKKAAIIAEDIDKRVEQFDPLEYFPKLFVSYYSLFAKHAGKIGEGLTETPPKLLKLYETDLEEFISW